ncbi:MAG TPA: hypothetical protein EYQ00_07185 [Dehalococcoidia bacterium]|jgi:hypothetical protein|nr:hypothetical protein [Dehalococcoidia bacterium]
MEWEAVLVVLALALATTRVGDVANAILGSVLPSGNIGPTSLKMDRVILWISAGILAVIGQNVIGFDMLTELGVGDGNAGSQLIWNILGFMALTDAMDGFARKKLL